MKKFFRHSLTYWVKCNFIKAKPIALLLAVLQFVIPVGSAFGDSLSRMNSASYWNGRNETELSAAWGIPDSRVALPDGRFLIVYNAGRTIGGAGFKMEKARFLNEGIEFRTDSTGVIFQYYNREYNDKGYGALTFIAGIVVGVVITLGAIALALGNVGVGSGLD